LLLAHNAKVDLFTKFEGVTALHLAVQQRNLSLVALLLFFRARPDLKTLQTYQTPYSLCVACGGGWRILELLELSLARAPDCRSSWEFPSSVVPPIPSRSS
jgi:hypothetical protein